MGIYLPNMEMPRKGQMLVIFPDGASYVCFNGMRERLTQTTAVPVPPHGDLVDRDALKKQGYFFPCAIGTEYAIPLRALREAPAVIPAEPCNNLSKPCKEEGET